MGERFTISARAYAYVAMTALAILVVIVFSGAAVRTTGSGLGCPDWPDCRGSFIPEADRHAWIEYSNRLLSSVVGLICIAAGVLALRLRPRRPELVRPGLVLALGVLAQGALGAASVLLHLHWPVVIGHYLLSLGLLTAAVLLVWRLGTAPGAPRPATDRLTVLGTRALVAYGGLIILLGTLATAAGPHAGGAGTGDVVERLRLWGPDTLVRLIKIHGHLAAAMGVAAIVMWLLARRRRASPELRRSLTGVCLLMGLQGAIGLWQYHTHLPAEIVWIHASLPAVLWTLLVWSWLAAGRPAATPAAAPGERPDAVAVLG
jgi:cytochrome c oxidase assembly protein subunit 15